MPINERFVCVRCKHKTLNRADNNPRQSSERSNPLFPLRDGMELTGWESHSCESRPLSSISLNVAFPVAVQLFPMLFFAFAGVSGSGSADKGWEEHTGRVLGPCFVPEALWVSLKQEETSCPSCDLSVPLRPCSHQWPGSACVSGRWVLHQLCLCLMQRVSSSSSPPLAQNKHCQAQRAPLAFRKLQPEMEQSGDLIKVIKTIYRMHN